MALTPLEHGAVHRAVHRDMTRDVTRALDAYLERARPAVAIR